MTPKQEAFVAAYIECRGNASEAARRAGYAGRADVVGPRLLRHPAVQAEVERWRAEVRSRGIAVLEQRIAAQQDRWERMQRVIQARAAEMVGEIAGGETGLIVRTKVTEFGSVFAVDAGLLREMRELEHHVAQELGQWKDTHEITGKDGGPVQIAQRPDLAQLSDEELKQLERLIRKSANAAGSDAGGD